MNKKIKSISKILLFPIIFSMFNYACSLAMEDEITYVLLNNDQKLEYMKRETNEGTKIEKFEDAFNKCFANVVSAFNKKYNYKYDVQFAKKIVLDNDFYNYFFETMKNIYNIKLLSYDNKLITSITLENDTVKLFLVFTDFISQLYKFYCVPTDKNSFTFKYNFIENDFFKQVTDWINKVQTSKLSDIEEIKNFNENEKQKFVDYCSNISDNIYNIFMLSTENTCNNKRNLSLTVEYSKTLKGEVSDIFVQINQ